MENKKFLNYIVYPITSIILFFLLYIFINDLYLAVSRGYMEVHHRGHLFFYKFPDSGFIINFGREFLALLILLFIIIRMIGSILNNLDIKTDLENNFNNLDYINLFVILSIIISVIFIISLIIEVITL